MTNRIEVSKVNTYAVKQRVGLRSTKVNTYAVKQRLASNVSKVNSYGVEQVAYGDLYQTQTSEKPLYNAGGGFPYIDQSGSGDGFLIDVYVADSYTFIVYKQDQTFSVEEHDLEFGTNEFPITSNFNQVVMLRGKQTSFSHYLIGAIKEGMKARV